MDDPSRDTRTKTTIGLIDAIISILHVLSRRDMTHEATVKALRRLKQDPVFKKLLDDLLALDTE